MSANHWCRQVGGMLALFVFSLWAAAAHGACSTYGGPSSGSMAGAKVVINEYNYSGNYVELRLNDTAFPSTNSTAFNNLRLRAYIKSGNSHTVTEAVVASAYPSSCGAGSPYIKINTGNLGNDLILVLFEDDTFTKELDYFRIGQSTYPGYYSSTCFASSELPSGSTVTYHQSLLTGSSARKDLARSPDGRGIWLTTPYNGGDQGTPCSSNDSTLNLTKTTTTPTVWLGADASFAVGVSLDGRADTQTSVTVTDPMPAGLSYVSHTATAGQASYAPTSDNTWNIGTLSAGGAATLNLTTRATTYGTATNVAAVQSSSFPAGTLSDVSRSVTVLTPAISVSRSASEVSTGQTVTFTITVTNPSSTLASPAFTVANVLSPGLSYASHTASGATSFDGGTGSWSIPGLAAGASATLTVTATVSQSGTLTDTATITMNGYNGGSAAISITGLAPTDYDAYVGTPGVLPTQRVGTGFTVTATAASAFTGNLDLELEYCQNVTRSTLGAIACGGSWAPIAGAVSTATFNNQTLTSSTFPAVNNAYEIVRIKLIPPSGSPDYSSDSFAIRPVGLTIVATDGDWISAGTARTLTGTTAGTTPTHKAGKPFSLTVSSGASNYPGTLLSAGTPRASRSVPGGSSAGTLSVGSWSATPGGYGSSTASYDAAGQVTLTLTDENFADIDAAQSSTSERYISGSVTIGRFIPDHLTLSVTPACPNFVYSGQAFSVEVRAFGSGASSPLLNYSGSAGYARDVTLSNAGTSDNFTGNTLAASLFLSNGIGTNSSITYSLGSPPGSDAEPLDIVLRAVDADLVSSEGTAEPGVNIRHGRLRFSNAFGSAALPLVVPMTLEYYVGGRWVRNTDDDCTTLTSMGGLSAITNPDPLGTMTPRCNVTGTACTTTSHGECAVASAVDGSFGLCLSAPMSAGSVNLSVGSLPTYLNFGNSVGRASFGLYNNSSRTIDRREVR